MMGRANKSAVSLSATMICKAGPGRGSSGFSQGGGGGGELIFTPNTSFYKTIKRDKIQEKEKGGTRIWKMKKRVG